MAEPNKLGPLDQPLSFREVALERLRTDIVIGHLSPGTLISAPAYGQSLGMSATPVREAMMDLSREGLVVPVRNKGFRVTEATDERLAELTGVRVLLEVPTVAGLAGQLSEDRIQELTVSADACMAAAEAIELEQFLLADRNFHALLLSYTGNQQLVELASSVQGRARLRDFGSVSSSAKLVASAQEHFEVIKSLQAGNDTQSAALMRTHIDRDQNTWIG